MKKYWLLFFAITPIGIGYLYSYLIINFYSNILNIILSLIFIIYWFVIGYFSSRFTKSLKKAFLLTNSVAIISIVLIIVQEVIIGHYFSNIFGIIPQMFFMPIITIASIVENIILFFLVQHHMWVIYIFSFVLMTLANYAGLKLGSKNR